MTDYKNLFFCDHCSKKDENGNKMAMEFYQKQKYIKHIQSLKHNKKINEDKNAEPSFKCDHCGEHFNSWSWDLHRERNNEYWEKLRGLKVLYGTRFNDLFKNLSCSSFEFKSKRYNTFKDLLDKNDIRVPYVATKEQQKKENERLKALEEYEKQKEKNSQEIVLDDGSTIQKKFTKVILDYCLDCNGWIDAYGYGNNHIEFQYLLDKPSYMTEYYLDELRNNCCKCDQEDNSEEDET